VQFTVSVKSAEPVTRVQFIVDGRPIGERSQPPYSIITMLGTRTRSTSSAPR